VIKKMLSSLLILFSFQIAYAETISEIQEQLRQRGINATKEEAFTSFLSVIWDEGDAVGKGVIENRTNECPGIRHWTIVDEVKKLGNVHYTRQPKIELLAEDHLVFSKPIYLPSATLISGMPGSSIKFTGAKGFVTCVDSSRIELSGFKIKMVSDGMAVQLGSSQDGHGSDASYTHLIRDLIIDYRGSYHPNLDAAIYVRNGQHLVVRNLQLYGTPYVNGIGVLVDGGDIYFYNTRVWGFNTGFHIKNNDHYHPKNTKKTTESKKHIGIYDSRVWGFGQYGILFDNASNNSVVRTEIDAPNQNQIGIAFKNYSTLNVIIDSVIKFNSAVKFYSAYNYSGSNQNFLIGTSYQGGLSGGIIVE